MIDDVFVDAVHAIAAAELGSEVVENFFVDAGHGPNAAGNGDPLPVASAPPPPLIAAERVRCDTDAVFHMPNGCAIRHYGHWPVPGRFEASCCVEKHGKLCRKSPTSKPPTRRMCVFFLISWCREGCVECAKPRGKRVAERQ